MDSKTQIDSLKRGFSTANITELFTDSSSKTKGDRGLFIRVTPSADLSRSLEGQRGICPTFLALLKKVKGATMPRISAVIVSSLRIVRCDI